MANNVGVLLIFILIAKFAAAIHLQHHQTAINDILKQLQQRFIAKVGVVKNDVERTNDLVKKQKDLFKKIAILEQMLLDQRNNILELLQISQFSLNQTTWTCEAFGPLQRSNLQTQEQIIKKNMTVLLSNLKSTLTNKPAYSSTIALTQSAQKIISSQKSPTNTAGIDLPSDRLQVRLASNFNYGFWAFGKTTIQQFRQQLKQQKNSVIQLCPFHRPFLDKNGNCKQCPISKPYWLLSQQFCVSCAQYNELDRQCLDKQGKLINRGFFTNFAAGRSRIMLSSHQKLGEFQVNHQNRTLCPHSTPFYDSLACIDCPQGLIFSLSDLTCRSCPSGQFHDLNSLTCKKQFYYSRTSSLAWSSSNKPVEDILESISLRKSNISYAQCPSTAPFSKDIECLACLAPQHFSYDTLSCVSCPQGMVLNLNQHRCVTPGNLNYQTNPINTTNLIYNGKSQQEWLNIYYQNLMKKKGIADCPIEQPYFDGVACIICPRSSPYFNLDTLICQQCQGTTLYSPNTKECLSNDSNRAIQTPTFEKMAAAVFA